MRLGRLVFVASLACFTGIAQQATSPAKSLVEDLKTLPSQAATKHPDPLSFTDMLERHTTDSQADVAAALPLLKQYLQSSDDELRGDAIFTIYALARRPNSSSELASVLPDLYTHLAESDIHLRLTTLLAIQTLKPQPPDEAITAMIAALEKANVSDDFGIALSESLSQLRPIDENAQNAILAYVNKPGLSDSRKADVIEAIGNPQLGGTATQEVVAVANASPVGRLRDAAIISCSKIGSRAVNQIKGKLYSIQADPSETLESHDAVRRALSTLK